MSRRYLVDSRTYRSRCVTALAGRCTLTGPHHYDLLLVERSESADAWDDGHDGELYPAAPTPTHERHWRHPSEMGHAAWVASEPPMAIGRGLTVTTGAIGCVLGVAVLWLLTPMGGELAATTSPIATSSVTAARFSSEPATLQFAPTSAAAPPTPSSAPPRITPASVDTATDQLVPTNTVLVMIDGADESSAIGVAIGDASFIVTTALAVSGSTDVSMMSIDGPTDGVVIVAGDLAMIHPSSALEVVGFAAVSAAEPGQNLVVLSGHPTEITNDADGTALLDASAIVEGTPVVDHDGALVALCTVVSDESGAHVELVPIVDPADGSSVADQPAPSSTDTPSPDDPAPVDAAAGWLGVRFGGAATAPLTIAVIAPGSPAALAGLVVGERITAIDGVSVATVDEVLALIATKPPGTVVVLTVQSPAPAGSPPSAPAAATTTISLAPANSTVAPPTPVSTPAAAPTTTVSPVATTATIATTSTAVSTSTTAASTSAVVTIATTAVSTALSPTTIANPPTTVRQPSPATQVRSVSVTLGAYEPTL